MRLKEKKKKRKKMGKCGLSQQGNVTCEEGEGVGSFGIFFVLFFPRSNRRVSIVYRRARTDGREETNIERETKVTRTRTVTGEKKNKNKNELEQFAPL